MQRVVAADQKDGLRAIRSSSGALVELGSLVWTSLNGDHPVYEAVFVKACETLALGFVFAGSDQDAVNKIIAAKDVN
jgi:hypothetical protein